MSKVIRKVIVAVFMFFYKLFHTETSKWILRFCDLILVVTLGFTIHGWIMGNDVMSMAEIIKSLCGLTAAAHSFYFWKSKVENCRKYPDVMECLKNGIDLTKDSGGYYQ